MALNQREGLGKAKHICIQELWLQDARRKGEIIMLKVPGEHNPSDLYTKVLSADRIRHLMGLMGYHFL